MINTEATREEIVKAFSEVNRSFMFKNLEEWFNEFLIKMLPVLPKEQINEIYKIFISDLANLKSNKINLDHFQLTEVTFLDKFLNDLNALEIRKIKLDEEILAFGVVLLKTSRGGLLGELKLDYREGIYLGYSLCELIDSLNDYKYGIIEKEEVLKKISLTVQSVSSEKRELLLKNLSLLLKTFIEAMGQVYDLYGEIAKEIDLEIYESLLTSEMFGSEREKEETLRIIKEFLEDYSIDREKPIKDFLIQKFKKYPELWKDNKEIENTAEEIIKGVEEYNKEKERLLEAEKAWGIVFSTIEIDSMIKNFNEVFWRETANKNINYRGLHGDIAEIWHTETFNLNAKLKGFPLRAERLKSYDPNSPDIVIKDQYGNIVSKYQSKYSVNADTTIQDAMERNYSDQKLIVPKDQLSQIQDRYTNDPKFKNNVKDVTDKIREGGVESAPLSREEAERIKEKAREKAPIFDWSLVSTKDIIKFQTQQTARAIWYITLFEGIKRISQRTFNYFKGKKNPPLEEEIKEWMNSSVKSAVPVAINSAITAGLIIAAKKGLIKALSKTPPGKIAIAVAVAMDNAKIMYKAIKGEITWREAIPAMTKITTISVTSLSGATIGAKIGAAVGSIILGIGTLIGGFLGGLIGGYIGTRTGEKVCQLVSETVKETEVVRPVVLNRRLY